MESEKKKPTADRTGSGLQMDDSGEPSPPTIRDLPAPVNTPARSSLERILDVATTLQHDEGHMGQYVRDGRDVYWLDGRSGTEECVGTIDDTGDLVILPMATRQHPTLVMTCDLKATVDEYGGALVVRDVVGDCSALEVVR